VILIRAGDCKSQPSTYIKHFTTYSTSDDGPTSASFGNSSTHDSITYSSSNNASTSSNTSNSFTNSSTYDSTSGDPSTYSIADFSSQPAPHATPDNPSIYSVTDSSSQLIGHPSAYRCQYPSFYGILQSNTTQVLMMVQWPQ